MEVVHVQRVKVGGGRMEATKGQGGRDEGVVGSGGQGEGHQEHLALTEFEVSDTNLKTSTNSSSQAQKIQVTSILLHSYQRIISSQVPFLKSIRTQSPQVAYHPSQTQLIHSSKPIINPPAPHPLKTSPQDATSP